MLRPCTLTILALALAFLSCNSGDGVAPPHPGALRADALAAATLPSVRISEFHYDNASTDSGEVDGPDGVRLRIWSAGGVVVYDNQPGARDDSWTVTPLGGGNVSVKARGGTP